jgi:hypothetical protein
MRKRTTTCLRLTLALVLAASSARAADKTVWKPIDEAMLKIDEKPVKLWSLFREEKDKHTKRLLLQLGSRFLLIDTENREVLELRPEGFERRGKDLRQGKTGPPAKVLPTSEWNLREAGMVRIIHARLSEEGRVVEIQLPSLPDLRY